MEKERKYSLILKERLDGSFSINFQDPSWHREGCPLMSVAIGPGGFFMPRRFINFPEEKIEFCYDCKNFRFIEN